MKNLLTRLLEAARCFTIIDFAIFKLCLLSFGILLGTYFAVYFREYIAVVWIVAAICAIYMYIQVIRYFKR